MVSGSDGILDSTYGSGLTQDQKESRGQGRRSLKVI